MKIDQATTAFEALSSEVRLKVFRLLVSAAPDGLVAGDIAKQLALPATNLSFHLKVLVHAGLISMEQEGRFSRYKANIHNMLDLIIFLTEECCGGQPEHWKQYGMQCGSVFDSSTSNK